jgi:hypothetical protein
MNTPDIEHLFKFKKEKTPNDALNKAFLLSNQQSRVLVIPQGTTSFLTIKINKNTSSFN